jgi:hypothetical protein
MAAVVAPTLSKVQCRSKSPEAAKMADVTTDRTKFVATCAGEREGRRKRQNRAHNATSIVYAGSGRSKYQVHYVGRNKSQDKHKPVAFDRIDLAEDSEKRPDRHQTREGEYDKKEVLLKRLNLTQCTLNGSFSSFSRISFSSLNISKILCTAKDKEFDHRLRDSLRNFLDPHYVLEVGQPPIVVWICRWPHHEPQAQALWPQLQRHEKCSPAGLAVGVPGPLSGEQHRGCQHGAQHANGEQGVSLEKQLRHEPAIGPRVDCGRGNELQQVQP